MTLEASRSEPLHRALRITPVGLALLALVGGLFVMRRPFMMSAPTCLAGRWHGCLDTFNGVVFVTVLTLPLSALLVWALASRRAAAGVPSPWRVSLAEVGMLHGTLPFVWIALMPGSGAGVVPGRVSLVPLRDLATMGTLGIVGNLLVFAALGFFGPIRFARLASVPRVVALAAGLSVLVEVTQYVLQLDRVSSVDDVLLNAAGALPAALASRPWWRTPDDEVNLDRSRRQNPRPRP
jgi:glycopeptide antibiotics resistance protein